MAHSSFDFYRVALQKGERGSGSQVVIVGEISNRGCRSFSAVSIQANIRNGDKAIKNVTFVVYGLLSGTTKRFGKSLDDLKYDEIVSVGTECECSVENAF